jgi:hypothetical protein
MVREPIGWTGENLRKQNIEKLHPDSEKYQIYLFGPEVEDNIQKYGDHQTE